MNKKFIVKIKKKALTSLYSFQNISKLIRENNLNSLSSIINQKSFDINQKIDDQQTLLHIAFSGNHYRVVSLFLEYSANPFIEDSNGLTVYSKALKSRDSKSRQILFQFLENVDVLIKYNQWDIIRTRIIERKIIVQNELMSELLKYNKYKLIKEILPQISQPEIQKMICRYCLNNWDLDLYNEVIRNNPIEVMLKEQLKNEVPWHTSFSKQQVEFLIQINNLDFTFQEFINITNKNLLYQITAETGKWRSLIFKNVNGMNLLKQSYINFVEYLENGYQYGIKVGGNEPVNCILISTDSVTAKNLFLTGFQLGLMTVLIHRIKKKKDIVNLEQQLINRKFYHRKVETKWIKYQYDCMSEDGKYQFIPLDKARNTCDKIQYVKLKDFIEKSDKTKFFTNNETPVKIRENNINLAQQKFIRNCWEISPLWLQLLLEKKNLPCIIFSDISSRKAYNNLIISLNKQEFKLGDLFPISCIDYEEYIIKTNSHRIEPGISLLLTCGRNTDTLNYLDISSYKKIHMIDIDLYAHNTDDLSGLLNWSGENSEFFSRIYMISTGSLLGYYHTAFFPDFKKYQWQMKYLDTGVAQIKESLKPLIKPVSNNTATMLKKNMKKTIEKEDRILLGELFYIYYLSTGNHQDREEIEHHFYESNYIKEVLGGPGMKEKFLVDNRFQLLCNVFQAGQPYQIITGTDITRRSLNNDTQFKEAVITTQGEKKLLTWEQPDNQLYITCWMGRRTIRLLTSRVFSSPVCLFDQDAIKYTDRLFQLLKRLEQFFAGKNPVSPVEFNQAFKRPMASIYKDCPVEMDDRQLSKWDDFPRKIELNEQKIKELKQQYKLDQKPGNMFILLDDDNILLLGANSSIYSCDFHREKSSAELENGETIITFTFKEKLYADITAVLLQINIINSIFSRTQGWRELLIKQISHEKINSTYNTICRQIHKINEVTFWNWADTDHYQIGPKDKYTHQKIWELYSPSTPVKKIISEWQKILEFRRFKLILGNRITEILDVYFERQAEDKTQLLLRQIFEYLSISEQEQQSLCKKLRKIIMTAREQIITGILKA